MQHAAAVHRPLFPYESIFFYTCQICPLERTLMNFGVSIKDQDHQQFGHGGYISSHLWLMYVTTCRSQGWKTFLHALTKALIHQQIIIMQAPSYVTKPVQAPYAAWICDRSIIHKYGYTQAPIQHVFELNVINIDLFLWRLTWTICSHTLYGHYFSLLMTIYVHYINHFCATNKNIIAPLNK